MPRSVREVMTKLVVVAPVDAGYTDLVRLMHDYRVSALPILDDAGAIVGVVSEADLIRKEDPELHEWHLFEGPHRRIERRKAAARTARDLMTSPAVVIAPSAPTSDAARLLRERRLKHLPVVDERKHVVGVVSRVDLLTAFLRGDEAIRGDVVGLVGRVCTDPDAVAVDVADGVARLGGLVRLRSEREQLLDRVLAIEGVIDVEADGLDFREDDTTRPVAPVPWVGF